MSHERWEAVDGYLQSTLIGPDEAFDAARAANAEAHLPAIDVSTTQGKFLHLLARMTGARRILEIGTLGGFSTIWLARALPSDGRLITLEIDQRHASVARSNVKRAGLGAKVEIRVGPALESLAAMAPPEAGPFDLVFIDADKQNNPRYVEHALRLTRPGSVIVVDNVIRQGAVLDDATTDPVVVGTREALALLGSDPRLDATALQTVGDKGWDGFAIAVVGEPTPG